MQGWLQLWVADWWRTGEEIAAAVGAAVMTVVG